MRVQIDEYRFDRHDLPALIPSLKSKNFTNWAELGLIDLQVNGRGSSRLLNVVGVIKLAAMNEVVLSGMRPPEAKALADKLTPRIYELWAGLPSFPERADHKVLPFSFFLSLEADVFIGDMFTRILRHVGVLPPLPAAPTPKRKPKAAKKGRRK